MEGTLILGIYLVVGIIMMLAQAEVFAKAGYSRWLSLLMIIPVVNIVVFLWFAFSEWPIHRFVSRDWKLRQLKQKKERLEKQISSLGRSEEEQQHHGDKPIEEPDIKKLKRLSEECFFKASNEEGDAGKTERRALFEKGKMYKERAEALEQSLEDHSKPG